MENTKLDIVNLIEQNPITELSKIYQDKLLTRIQETFTESQQRLFISSFYTYLNYNCKTDFIIELESVWKWLGFGRKEECKRVLTKHFKENIDYKIITKDNVNFAPQVSGAKINEENVASTSETKKETRGGYNKEKILMTINTFKKLCLKSDTKKADEIHDYYIKLEEILQKVIIEESEELKKEIINKNTLILEKDTLLLEKDTLLLKKDTNIEKLTKEKQLEKHNILLREFENIGSIIYIIKIKNFNNGTYIVKIGESRYGILERYKEHKKNYEESIILDCFMVRNSKSFELFLHTQLKQYKVTDLKDHEKENELFLIGKDITYLTIINIINKI